MPTHNTRRAVLGAIAAFPALFATRQPAAAPKLIDPVAVRQMIADLRTPARHLTVAENWGREDAAQMLEDLAGFETPADYKPYFPKDKAKHRAEMARLADVYGLKS